MGGDQRISAADQAAIDAFADGLLAATTVPIRFELDALGAVALLGALQLVLRHPELGGEVSEFYRDLARDIQEQLPASLAGVAAAGWRTSCDAQPSDVVSRDRG
jgi:hypothetical protein